MDDEEGFRQCSTPTCRAVYCAGCFEELENVCTVCLNPADYGDLSDVSEEKDSSEVDCDEGDSSESDEFETIRDFLRRRSSAAAHMVEGTSGAETPRPLQFLDV
ncbi:uncharacterized protein LOC125946428 [Dermacentor silvarum]|uniref:uncharacterized protein LOC125946428 n=1 Tax=Dermacentor silvarum TaxID=543639 RepID=UPI002101D18E|nr:uncharacterized protein LOC125946428 [Dermacentor silvarum]